MKRILWQQSLWLLLMFFQLYPAIAQQSKKALRVSDYIVAYQELAIRKSSHYHIPASIILGQGILESANGNSDLAVNANNHFGVKCHKDWKGETYYKDDDQVCECFRKYSSVDESYEDHSIFLTSRERYAFLFQLDPRDYKAWAHGLKQAGYATNPDYARLLIKVIEENRLDEIDKSGLALSGLPLASDTSPRNKTRANESFDPVIIGGPAREIWENNGVQFVYARQGDDVAIIAGSMGLMPWQIMRYNDLQEDQALVAGDIVYLSQKKRNAQTGYHMTAAGDDLWRISQRYAIKMKLLCRRNQLDASTRLSQGMRIVLNKPGTQ